MKLPIHQCLIEALRVVGPGAMPPLSILNQWLPDGCHLSHHGHQSLWLHVGTSRWKLVPGDWILVVEGTYAMRADPQMGFALDQADWEE